MRGHTLILLCAMSLASCYRQAPMPKAPPVDPLQDIDGAQLHRHGLYFARRGDYTRAQQYLSAALAKGIDARAIVPALVRVCVADSQLRAGLTHALPYLDSHPEDLPMRYVVGTIYLALGERNEGVAELKAALGGEPVVHEAAFALGLLADEEGDVATARAYLQRYLADAPEGKHRVRAQHLLGTLDQIDRPNDAEVPL